VDIMKRSAAVSRTAISQPMRRVAALARRLLLATEGTQAIEYALVAGLIALVIIGALADLGDALVALPLPSLITALGG
jgi:Flp pilus assembly pilin Flp